MNITFAENPSTPLRALKRFTNRHTITIQKTVIRLLVVMMIVYALAGAYCIGRSTSREYTVYRNGNVVTLVTPTNDPVADIGDKIRGILAAPIDCARSTIGSVRGLGPMPHQ